MDAQATPKANTAWFQQAGYGVFVHYLEGLQNNPDRVHSLGKHSSWDACVAEFDTEQFADQMKEAGAGYVIFTVMQITRHLIAPNATFDAISGYAPGEACATRDLIEDLYSSLHKRGIPLMLYWTGDGPRLDEQAGTAFGCRDSSSVSRDFVQKWAQVVREYGERYGEKVAGWWVDGCYPFIGYDEEKRGILADALRAGYPDRIIAMNPGVEGKVNAYTPLEDYTCGEQTRFHELPVTGRIDGEQWHIASFLGEHWGEPGTQYSKQELADYISKVCQRGGVVSVDVVLYRDGALDRSQLEVLKAVRPALEDSTPAQPIPEGNLAFGKPADLLSLDGSHQLVVNSRIHVPRLGVDGDPSTYALAGGEWPWTYQVDLVDTVPVGRVRITFGPAYATEFEVQASVDRASWVTAAHCEGHDGSSWEASFETVPARFIRIRGLKPDGPGQPGSQMSIAELEVYAAGQDTVGR